MAGRRSPVTDIRELIRHMQRGEPDRRIARDLGVSRNTVARYRQWATEARERHPDRRRRSRRHISPSGA
jgi:FixJ family two-component response regulator